MNEIEIESLAAKAIETENFTEARRLLEPLVKYDSEYALMTLAWMHEAGKGGEPNLKLAASLYRRVADIGCLEAYNCLGRVLRDEGDLIEVRNAFTKGAELGNLGSMAWLGVMMLAGDGGPVDNKNGILWINTAAERGHLVAKGQLLILERQNSKSMFRHIIYHFKRVSLGLRATKGYLDDPYSGKVF
jgi:TPR repeat protein